MLQAPEFSSLIVSRKSPRGRAGSKLRALALAATLYGTGLVALIVGPWFILEMVDPPKAGVEPPHIPLIFNPPGGGHQQTVGHSGRGAGGGRKDAHPATATKTAPSRPPVPRPADNPTTPPESTDATYAGPTDGPFGPDGPPGDPDGPGDRPGRGRKGDCPTCPGTGPDIFDGPYEPGTAGLIPPSLIPGSRALPKYPELARRAGLQGTVILLVVIEKDGTVGTVEVVKSPDQRWGFDLTAIDAVKQWRYQPALMNGRPVAASISVMVEFTLVR
jgi:protein TonB